MKNIIIIGYSNVTKEGVTLHLNKKTQLKRGNITSDTFWISWDKIGKNLFYSYTGIDSVNGRNELRDKSVSPSPDTKNQKS